MSSLASGIDMLPLLDVFMVVLFVFATIQEHVIEDSSLELATLHAKLEAAEARAARLDQRLAEYRQLCGPAKPGGTSCGVVPSAGADRATWIDDGGQGLLDGLRRTRGGNAIVLIRQGSRARYRLTNALADALREQLPEHRIYDDGQVAQLDCPLLPR